MDSKPYYLRRTKARPFGGRIMAAVANFVSRERREGIIVSLAASITFREATHAWGGSGPIPYREDQIAGGYADYLQRKLNKHGAVRIYTASVAELLFSTSLYADLEAAGWQRKFFHARGATELLRLSPPKGRGTLEMVSLAAIGARVDPEPSEPLTAPRRLLRAWEEVERWIRFVRDQCGGACALTLAAQAWQEWRRTLPEDPQERNSLPLVYHDRKVAAFSRQAYAGGRCQAFQVGTFTDGPFALIDRRSAYPYILRTYRFPRSLVGWVPDPSAEDLTRAIRGLQRCVIADVELDTDVPLYPVRGAHRAEHPTGKLRTTLCTASLIDAIQRGHLVRCHSAMVWSGYNPFEGYISHWWNERQEARRVKDSPREGAAKLMLNALSGKLAARSTETLIDEPAEPGDVLSEGGTIPYRDLPEEVRPLAAGASPEDQAGELASWNEVRLFGRRTVQVEGAEARASLPHVAAHCTDYGRAELNQAIERVGWENVLYADTDSLIARVEAIPPNMRRESEQLGAWGLVLEADEVRIDGPKRYVIGGKIAASGTPRTVQEATADTEVELRVAWSHHLAGHAGRGYVTAPRIFTPAH